MLLHLATLLFGGTLLYFGAEWLVRGSAGLARAFSVSPLIVGLTVVAYGTSAPELVVSSIAALDGRSALALGNVLGSNIANLGLILGLSVLISPPAVEGTMIRREVPILLVATLVVPAMLYDGGVGRVDAALLLLGGLAFTSWTLKTAKRTLPAVAEPLAAGPAEGPVRTRLELAGLALLGLAVLVAGAELFVRGATGVALALGLSERVVGLTIVALGTSLPELATSLVAAARRESAIAVGNVVGSNLFNLLFVLGAAGLIAPLEGSLATYGGDSLVMLGMTALGAFALRGARLISRVEGALLLGGYVVYLVSLASG